MSEDLVLVSHDGTIRYTARDVAKFFVRYHLTPAAGTVFAREGSKPAIGCAIGALSLSQGILTEKRRYSSTESAIARLKKTFSEEFIGGIPNGFDGSERLPGYICERYGSECSAHGQGGPCSAFCRGTRFGYQVGHLVFHDFEAVQAQVEAENTSLIIAPMTIDQADLAVSLI